jgi:iron complex outermembrane receptor protein
MGKHTSSRVCKHEKGVVSLAPGHRSRLAQAVSLAVIAGASANPLSAQQLEEVVVTATKRSESVLDVPIAMTAMSGNEIRQVNLNDIKDLISFTPGISGNSKDSFLDFVSVRGIRTIDFGNGGDPSIGLYTNGLYQGRTGSGVSSLYDIERSEVLRGPQGFLFARNAVSGAINVITAKASTEGTEGYAEVDVGERGVFVFEGAVNVPLTDNLAMRVAGFHTEEDGYVDNLQGGPDLISHDNDSLRVSFRYETDKLTADLILQYDDRNQYGSVYRLTGEGDAFNEVLPRFFGGQPPALPSDGRAVNVNNLIDPRDNSEIYSAALLLDYDLGWATFTSVTGYKEHEYEYGEDYDATPRTFYEYGQEQEGDYFEQEVRLVSNSEGPLDWYAGASLYNEDIDTTFLGLQEEDIYCQLYLYYYGEFTTCQAYYDYLGYDFTPSTNGLINDRNRIVGKYQGYSAYLDLRYQLSDTFDVAAGIRYSWDEKEFSQEKLPDVGGSAFSGGILSASFTPEGALTDTQDWSETTYRLIANWRPNNETLLFGSITTGYKPGGYGSFNLENIATGETITEGIPGRDRPGDFGPETVTSYEVGYKGTLFDGRTQLSLTGFYYQYEDLQTIFTEGIITIVDNVGEIDGWGSEVELYTALSDNVTLRFGGSWFDSEANGVQAFCGAGEVLDPVRGADACEGNSIPWAPEFTAFAVLNATYPVADGEAFGMIAWSWEDDYRGDWPDPGLIFQEIQALDQTDIQLGYRTDSWSVLGYVENVFDNVWYDGNYADDPTPGVPYAQQVFGPSRPRTAGIRASYSF